MTAFNADPTGNTPAPIEPESNMGPPTPDQVTAPPSPPQPERPAILDGIGRIRDTALSGGRNLGLNEQQVRDLTTPPPADPFADYYANQQKEASERAAAEAQKQAAAQVASVEAEQKEAKPDRIEYIPKYSSDQYGDKITSGVTGRVGSMQDYAAVGEEIIDAEAEVRKNKIETYRATLENSLGVENLDSANLRQIMEALGEDYDQWRDSQYRTHDLVPKEYLEEQKVALSGESVTKSSADRVKQEAQEAQEARDLIFDSADIEKPDSYLDAAFDPFNPFAQTGFETATRRRIASQAVSRAHLDTLIDAELNRYTRASEGAVPIDDRSMIDDYSWQFGTAMGFARSFAQQGANFPETMAGLGIMGMSAGTNLLGFGTPEFMEEWVFAEADRHAQKLYHNTEFSNAYTSYAGDGFLAQTLYRGAETAGMLSFDIGTSLLTGKLPIGLIPAVGKATAKGTARLSARGARVFFDDTFGKGATAAFKRKAQSVATRASALRPPTRARPGYIRDASGNAVTNFFNREVRGFNTFLYRVGGESFVNSYARQADRAVLQGRELDGSDVYFATQDAIAHMTIAHLIGKNIPGVTRFPTRGAGSRGLHNVGPYSTATMHTALRRAVARTSVRGVRSGADFMMFDVLMDAYALTDSEDRARVLDEWTNKSGKKMQHLFGSFLIGGAIGAAHLPGNFKGEIRKIRDAKSGAEAWRRWSSLSEAEKKSYMDFRSEAFLQGMREQMARERKSVEDGLLLTGISNEKLAEILFYGERELPEIAIMAGLDGIDPLSIGHRFSVEGSRVKDSKLREQLQNSDGTIGITRGMALAEAQRRGMSLDTAQFTNGKVDFLFEGRAANGARREKYREQLAIRRTTALNKPPSPKGVRAVSVAGATKQLRSRVVDGIMRLAGISEADKIVTPPAQFIRKVIRHARLSENPEMARAVTKSLKDARTINEAFAAARKNIHVKRAIASVVASERHFSPRAANVVSVLRNVVRANPGLTRWVVGQVHRGRNTTANPALSRRQMERLFPDLSPAMNTKSTRQGFASDLALSVQDRMTGPMLRTPRYGEGRPRIARTSNKQKPIRIIPEAMENYKPGEITSQIDTRDNRIPIDRAAPTETRREAADRGVEAIDLERQSPAKAKAQTETTTTEQAEQGSPRQVLDRLESTNQKSDPIVEVTHRLGKMQTRNRVRKAVESIENATGIEVQFSGEPGSSLMAAIAPQANASGFAVIVATGQGRFIPRISYRQGVVIVRSDVGARAARLAIARRTATERWLQETPDFSPAAVFSFMGENRPYFNSRLRKIVAAITGQEIKLSELKEFFDNIAATRRDRRKDAVHEEATLWETVMPLLTDRMRAEVFRTVESPAVFARWYLAQQAAYKEFGFESPRANADLLGGKKTTEAMERIASGEATRSDLSKDSTLSSKYAKALNEAFVKRELLEPNADLAILRRQIDRASDASKVEPAPTPKEPTAIERTETEVARERESNQPIELFSPKEGYKKGAINELEGAYPGIVPKIEGALAEGKGQPRTFEHMGKTVEVFVDKGVVSVRVNEPSATDRRGVHSENTMTEGQKETADKATELIERGTESTTVDAKDLVGEPPKPPKPPKDAPAGEPAPEPSGVSLTVNESAPPPGLLRRLANMYLAGVGRFLQDPKSLAIHAGNDPFKRFVDTLYTIEQAIRDEQGAALFKLNQAHRALVKDRESTLLTDQNGKRLVDILESPIPADKVDTHPLTSSLRQTERAYIKTIRELNESMRQEMIADKRKAISMSYKYGSAKQNVERIREAKPEWSVKTEKDGRKTIYAIDTGKGLVRLNKDTLPEFMAKELVTENFGYKDSYFPHLFFGNYKGNVTIKGSDGSTEVLRFGAGEKLGREAERAEILAMVEQAIEAKRAANPELTYEFNVNLTENASRVSQDAIYMPGNVRRNLVSAIKNSSSAHRSEINSALNGKVESRAVKTAFLPALLQRKGAEGYSTDVHRVMELATQNFYRNKMARQIQEQGTPLIREMESGTTQKWIPEYARRLANHTVFGTRGMERTMREAGMGGLVDFGDRSFGYLRGFQFYRQLVRPGQHIINSTQSLQVWSLLGSKEFAGAIKDYNSAAGKEFIKEWGFFDQAGFNPGKFGDSLTAGTGSLLTVIHTAGNKAIGKVWNVNSEQRNQNFAFYALARHGMNNLNMQPKEAAQYGRIWGSLFTQYRYSRANDPVFLRGNMLKTIGQFKRFQIQTLGMAMALAQNAKSPGAVPGVGRSALGRFMLLNTVMGGVRGSLLGFGLLAAGAAGGSVYSAIRQMFDDEYLPSLPDKPFKSEAAAYKWLFENGGAKRVAGAPLAEVAMFGVGRFAGVDMSGNFNLTNLGPGGLGQYFLGPTGGMLTRTYADAFGNKDALNRPSSIRMIESMIDSGAATRSVKALYEYIRFHDQLGDMDQAEFESTMLGLFGTGRRRAGTSELIMDRDKFDFVADIMGLRSADYTSQYMISSIGRVIQETWTDARNRIASTYNTDPEKAYQMMGKWNDAYGGLAPMSYSDISAISLNAMERVTDTRDERNLARLSEPAERVEADLLRLRNSNDQE